MNIKCLFGFHKEIKTAEVTYNNGRKKIIREIYCTRCGKKLGIWFANGKANDYSKKAKK